MLNLTKYSLITKLYIKFKNGYIDFTTSDREDLRQNNHFGNISVTTGVALNVDGGFLS